jgi:hypothetical protein
MLHPKRSRRLATRLLALPLFTLAAAGCAGSASFGLAPGDDAGMRSKSGQLSPDASGDSAAQKDAPHEGVSSSSADADPPAKDTTPEGDLPDARDAAKDGPGVVTVDASHGDASHVDAGHGDGGTSLLGSAGPFAVLAGSMITITASTPSTSIVGDVAVSPGTAIATLGAGQPMGSVHQGDAVAAKAQDDLTTAYDALVAMDCPAANDRSSVDLGGQTLAPGVYCFGSSAGLTGPLVLDADGDPGAAWVIQIGSTLTTAAGSSVTVTGGGSACNVYWQIGSSATIGAANKLAGSFLAFTTITVGTGSNLTTGRLLARGGEVSLDTNDLSAAACQ